MQVLTGILFVAAWALAVIFGGQTLDYSWGPALIVLGLASLASLFSLKSLRERGPGAWVCILLLAAAWAWVLYGCAYSPVKEFARSDALLAGGMALCFAWGLLLPPGSAAVRVFMAGLALLGIANGAMALAQLSNPGLSWPYASQPSAFPSGFFGHYNHLADFAAAGAALLAARAIFARDRLGERILQGLGVIAFITCVACSKSRGGMAGLAAGAEVVAIGAFLIALRERSPRRGAIALIPLAMLILGAVGTAAALRSFENSRGVEDPTASRFADNRSRLLLEGVAFRVTSNFPLHGGGSRSFGWQKYAAWNADPMSKDGPLPTNDDFAHNEMLQTAVDYGWMGAGLVAVAVIATGLTGLGGLTLRDEQRREPRFATDAAAIGGLGAMTATLVNSNFSFVTHTLPGAMYLGLALAFALPRRTPAPAAYLRRLYSAIPTGVAITGGAAAVVITGIAACRAFLLAWPVGNTPLAIAEPNTAADRLASASALWPSSSFDNAAGQICQAAAARPTVEREAVVPYLQRAADFYQSAARLYPYTPVLPFSRAQVLVAIAETDLTAPAGDQAEEAFETAVTLQGGMEGLLRVRYYYGRFLVSRWSELWLKHRRAAEAYTKFLRAHDVLEEAHEMTEPYIQLNQITDLLDQVEKKIDYLEDAGFGPQDQEDER